MSTGKDKAVKESELSVACGECAKLDSAARLATNGLVKAYLYLIFKEENLCTAEMALNIAKESKGMDGVLRNQVEDIVTRLPILSSEEKRIEFHKLICNMKNIELSKQLKAKGEPEFEIEMTESAWNFIEQHCEELTITPSELVTALLIILLERRNLPPWLQESDGEEASPSKSTTEEVISIPVFASDEYEQ